MARKISVTKEMVKSAAFAIMREEGMDGLTARRLADKTGCSTQPIFRIYENMNELHEEAFAMAIAYYTDFLPGIYEGQTDRETVCEFWAGIYQFRFERAFIIQSIILVEGALRTKPV